MENHIADALLAARRLRRALMIFERKGLEYALTQHIGNLLLVAVLFVIGEGLYRGWKNQRRDAAG